MNGLIEMSWASTHPVFLLSRPGGDICSLYHSFFVVNRVIQGLGTSGIEVVYRCPSRRRNLDDIESGIQGFSLEIFDRINNSEEEQFGFFIVTTSDSNRYYAIWRGKKDDIFVAISRFPIIHYTRTVFKLLQNELFITATKYGKTTKISNSMNIFLRSLLIRRFLALIDIPILAGCGLKYEITFPITDGAAILEFSAVERPIDGDVDVLPLMIFTPQMIVDSWEAMILEEKVLVVSSRKDIIAICSEFISRLILPMQLVNFYVPLLPRDLIDSIQAPFPYLLGVYRGDLTDDLEIPNSIVVDLDQRAVYVPNNHNDYNRDRANYIGRFHEAPPEMKHDLISRISSIMTDPIAEQFHSTASTADKQNQPLYHNTFRSIERCIVGMNLSLLSARTCNIRAFYRRPMEWNSHLQRTTSLGKASAMGYEQVGDVYCGCMQFLRERVDKSFLKFLPCWVEMNSLVLAIYEFADEFPLYYIPIKEIAAILPSPVEPEGHVFEILLTSQHTYRLATPDLRSRQVWIDRFEQMIGGGETNLCTSNTYPMSPSATNNNSTVSSTDTNSTSSISSLGLGVSRNFSSPGNSFNQNNTRDGTNNNNFDYNNHYISPTGYRRMTSSSSTLNYDGDTLAASIAGLGTAATTNHPEALSYFRWYVMKTQMVSVLRSKLDYEDFDSMFSSMGVSPMSLYKHEGAFGLGHEDFWTSTEIRTNINHVNNSVDLRNDHYLPSADKKKRSSSVDYDPGLDLHRNSFSKSSNTNSNIDDAFTEDAQIQVIPIEMDQVDSDMEDVQQNSQADVGMPFTSKITPAINTNDNSENQNDHGTSSKKPSRFSFFMRRWHKDSNSAPLESIEKNTVSNLKEYTEYKSEKEFVAATANDSISNTLSSSPSFRPADNDEVAQEKSPAIEAEGDVDSSLDSSDHHRPSSGLNDTNSDNYERNRRLLSQCTLTHSLCEVELNRKLVDTYMSYMTDEDGEPSTTEVIKVKLYDSDFDCGHDLGLNDRVSNATNNSDYVNFDIDESLLVNELTMKLGCSSDVDAEDSKEKIVDECSANVVNSSNFWYSFLHDNMNLSTLGATVGDGVARSSLQSDDNGFRIDPEINVNNTRNAHGDGIDIVVDPIDSEVNVYLNRLDSDISISSDNNYGQYREEFRTKLVKDLTNQMNATKNRLSKAVINSMLGNIYERLNIYHKALNCYGQGMVNQHRIMYLLVRKFVEMYLIRSHQKSAVVMSQNDLFWFVKHGLQSHLVTGLHAYRLVVGMILARLSRDMNFSYGSGLFIFRGSEVHPTRLTIDNDDEDEYLVNNRYNRKQYQIGKVKSAFTYVTRNEDDGYKVKGVLNESVICTNSEFPPCELVVELGTRLCEIVRSITVTFNNANKSRAKHKNPYDDPNLFQFATEGYGQNQVSMPLTPELQCEIRASSAFCTFEVQICQLQLINPLELSAKDQLLFWVNVYNILSLHSSISLPIPNTFLDFFAFKRNGKYNIGNYVVSQLDIEHGILRANSAKMDALIISWSFSNRDPRKILALKDSTPNMTFSLYQGQELSPPFTILTTTEASSGSNNDKRKGKDIKIVKSKEIKSEKLDAVDIDLARCAKDYCSTWVIVTPSITTVDDVIFTQVYKISLPEMLRFYYKDFAANKKDMIIKALKLAGIDIVAELLEGDKIKYKVQYISYDWKARLKI